MFTPVYTLWRIPDLLPAFTTWPPVVQKLMGGAGESLRTPYVNMYIYEPVCVFLMLLESSWYCSDLMLPGVVVSSTGLPDVTQGDCCAVNLVSNW